jgi:hypothetical protein
MDAAEFNALVEEFFEERLTEAGAARLSAVLETSSEARALYWEAASVHGQLEYALKHTSAVALSGRALSLGHFMKVCAPSPSGEIVRLTGRLRAWFQRCWNKILKGSIST